MAEPTRPRSSCCACMCFRRAPNKSKPEEDEDTSSIVFYRKFSDVWEEDSAEEEIITCSQPLDDRTEHNIIGHNNLRHHLHSHLASGDPCDRRAEYRRYLENMRGVGSLSNNGTPVRVHVDSSSDVTSWVETPDSGEQTELIGHASRQTQQRMRDTRRLLTLPLKEDRYSTEMDDMTSPESDYCDELTRHRAADLSFSIDDSISNFMQSRVTMWTAGSGLLNEEGNMLQEEVWSIHSDSAILLRDYMFPNEDWQASLDSFGSDLDLSHEDDEEDEEEGEDENGNGADESTKILKSKKGKTSSGSKEHHHKSSTRSSNSTTTNNSRHEENGNGNRKYFQKSPMSLPGDAYRPVRSTYDMDTARVHRNINDTRNCLQQRHEKHWMQHGVKRKEAASTPEDDIEEAPLQSEIAA